MSEEIMNTQSTDLVEVTDVPMGFDEDDSDELIIPRVKMVQSLSPERKDKKADEGDIINSLTCERLNGKVFVPVFKFNNNILWRDRSQGGGIECIARDAHTGVMSDGTTTLCSVCRKCEFNNQKVGREAIPTCTKYINFFGFFANERTPIILSFSKTNIKEGKTMYSQAKFSMQNMWNFGYALNEKMMSKNGNDWFIIAPTPAGATSAEDREFGLQLYKSYRDSMQTMAYDMNEGQASGYDEARPAVDTANTEF